MAPSSSGRLLFQLVGPLLQPRCATCGPVVLLAELERRFSAETIDDPSRRNRNDEVFRHRTRIRRLAQDGLC
jgi:hypothetical protein